MPDSFIQVGPDGTGKKVDNTIVQTSAGSVCRQGVSVGDPDSNIRSAVTSTLPSAAAAGLVTRTPRPNVDTGIVAPNSVTLIDAQGIAASDFFLLDGINIVCTAGSTVQVTVTNGADQAIIPTMTFYGPQFLTQSFCGMPTTGLKWAAGNGVTLHAWGRK